MAVELTYCVVSNEQRPLLRYCLDAIARERAAVPFATEVLVLDNASADGSAEAAHAHPATTTLIAVDQRRSRAQNQTHLMREASGRFCLLLNEDSELEPGATASLHDALAADERAAAAAATLVDPDGSPLPSAWRFPGVGAALLGVVGLHARRVVQSRGGNVRAVDWAPPAALLVRRAAAEAVGWLDPELHESDDGPDFGKRLHDAGWNVLYVPEARAVHHGAREPAPADRQHDRYMRKHHSAASRSLVHWLTATRNASGAAASVVRRKGAA